MRKTSALLLAFLLLSTGFFVLISASAGLAGAASPTAYVPVTLTNSQTTATPENFSQLIKVNWSVYASYLNANVSNVRFYSSTTFSSANELSGWVETNNSTAATSSNVWVNLSSTIVPASGTATIYMGFLETTASWSSHWGLAPQLSRTYGQFDNGAEVFALYVNGNTPISDFNIYNGVSLTQATGVTYGATKINALHITGNDGGVNSLQVAFITKNSAASLVAESNFQQGNPTSGVSQGEIVLANSATVGASTSAIDVEMGYGKGYFSEAYMSGGTGTIDQNQAGTDNSNWNFASVQSVSGYASFYGYIAPQLYSTTGGYSGTVSTNPISSSTGYYIGFGIASTSSSYPWNSYINWARARTYPPAGMMPSASFGSVSTVIQSSGYQISFQQASFPPGAKWGIRLNNTTAVIWQNSTAEYDNLTGLAAGAYTFHVINATGYASDPYTGLLTIVSSNLTQPIVFTGYTAAFTETGLPTGLEWFVNLSNQPGLSESGTGQHLSTTRTSVSTTLPNTTYTFTFQDNMNTEYHGGSSSFTVNGAAVSESVTFAPVLYYVNFSAKSKPASVTWDVNLSDSSKFTTGQGIQFTASANISFAVTNGTYYYNASADNSTTHVPIGWWRLTNAAGTILLHNISTFGGAKVTVAGADILYNNITFSRAYNVTFEEVGIGNTYTWTDSLYNPITASAQQKILTVANSASTITYNSTEGNWTNGSYTITIQTLVNGATGVRYDNFSSFLSITVSGADVVMPVNFITQYFLTTRSTPAAGGYHAPYSEWVNASTVITLSAQPNSSYQFTGFIGSNVSAYTGPGSYSNGQFLSTILMTNPITENMTFGSYVVLTFYMQNLTAGAAWGIKLTQSGSLIQWDNGTGNYIVFEIRSGTYTYAVTGVKSYPQFNTISVSGSRTVLLQYQVKTYQIKFIEEGLPVSQPWTISVANSQDTFAQSSATDSIYFQLPNGTYSYSVSSVYGYITNNSSGSLTVAGSGRTNYIIWTEGNPFILEGIRYFVPIFLNTTNYTIPAGTQIPLNINWSKYQSYENENLSNAMILNSTFYPLYSWIENNASSGNASSTVWTKLDQGIAYYSSQLLYLAFMQSQKNNFDSVGYWGEAPQLSPVYGEWNNIRLVMNHGLLLQIYTNTSAAYLFTLPAQSVVLNANYTTGSFLSYAGNRYAATVAYTRTAALGYQQEVYQDSSGGYVGYATEQNVLISYQTAVGSYPGTWPSPPIISTPAAQTWFAKAQGFVEQNQQSVTWYSMDDDGAYLVDSGSGYYLNSNWTHGTPLINRWQSSATSLMSAASSREGTSRISFAYAETDTGEAIWQFWTSAPVSYYSPSPVDRLPTASFGTPGSSYSSFTEYGLPSGTTWAVGIDGRILQSGSNVIYDYLPTGSYFFSVGSVSNDTFLAGIDGSFFPTPGQGFLTVNTFFTSQVILWEHANIKTYDLVPGQASAVLKSSVLNVTMPVFVTDINGLPANASTIATIWSHLQLSYVSKLQSQDFNVTWSFSNSGLGMFAVFFSLTKAQVNNVKNGTAVLSMVSAFRFGTFTSLATGVAGLSSFEGVNTSSPVQPPTNVLGLGPPPSAANLGSIQGVLNYLSYLGQSAAGRSLYFIAVFLAVAYYVLRINNENIKKARNKQVRK